MEPIRVAQGGGDAARAPAPRTGAGHGAHEDADDDHLVHDGGDTAVAGEHTPEQASGLPDAAANPAKSDAPQDLTF